jgi:hypothetical protein
MVLSIA